MKHIFFLICTIIFGAPCFGSSGSLPIYVDKDSTKHKNKTSHKYDKIVKYDFTSDSLRGKNIKWIKQNGSIDFDITNVNLFLYDVKINQEKQSYVDNELNQSKEWNATNVVFDSKGFGQNVSEIAFQLEDLSESLSFLVLKDNSNEVNPKMDTANFIKTYFGIDTKTLTNGQANNDVQLLELIKQLMKRYPQKILDAEKFKKAIVKAQEELNSDHAYYKLLLSTIYSDGIKLKELKRKREDLTSQFFKSTTGGATDLSTVISCILSTQSNLSNNSQNLKKELENIMTLLKSCKTYIDQMANSNYRMKIQTALNLDGSIENIKTINANISDLQKSTGDPLFEKLINNICSAYNSLNENNFNVHYRLYDLNNYDKIHINVTIKPRQNLEFSKPLRVEEFDIVTNTYAGVKFDVSTGLCFNVGLNDIKYHYDSLSTKKRDTLLIVENKNRDSYFPFLCTQLNVYWKPFPSNFGAGFCFGLSSNLSKVRYYFGGCFVFGKEENIVLSGGIAGGEIKTLADEYETGVLYPRKHLPTDPKTTEYFKLGGFFSLTYNLRGKKTKEFGKKIGG